MVVSKYIPLSSREVCGILISRISNVIFLSYI
nr:MAG TPA: hypothetical protein [Bacteriophage sp.]